MPRRSNRRRAGFALLEAIVALAILAAVGLAVFAAMSQSMQMVRRAEEARAMGAVMRNAMAALEQINPMDTETGEVDLGNDYRLHWSAVPIEPTQGGATGYLAPGLYDLTLYRMTLELRLRQTLVYTAQVRRVGYRQVRHPEKFE